MPAHQNQSAAEGGYGEASQPKTKRCRRGSTPPHASHASQGTRWQGFPASSASSHGSAQALVLGHPRASSVQPCRASIWRLARCRFAPSTVVPPIASGLLVGVDCDTPRRNAQRAAMQGVGLVTICTLVLVKLSSNARDCVSVKNHAYFLGNSATSDNTGYVTQPATGLPVIQNARPEPPIRGRDPPPAEGRSDRPSGPPRFSLDTRVPHACACAGRDITYPI